jgi:energy-coupling factor transport system ATP-binding protein
MEISSPRLEARGLSYTYPGAAAPALDACDLAVEPGEYLALVGANGSGKSTLLRLLVGLAEAGSGLLTLTTAERSFAPHADPPAARRLIGLIPQNPDDAIVGSIVEEDVGFGPANLGLDPAEVTARTAAALAAVGIAHLAKKPPHALSGGERQRVAVAGVLAVGVPVVLADEPAAMLDPAARLRLLDLFDALRRGRTLIHVTHDLAEAARADRIVVLFRGRPVFDGKPADLFGRPELAAWGLEIPESVAAVRALAALRPGFAPDGIPGPAAFARAWRASAASSIAAPVAAAPPIPAAPPAGENPALEFRSAGYEYLRGSAFAATALVSISLALPRGSRVALVGASGSGKSSLLRLAAALLLPGSGSVRILGLDPTDRRVDLRRLRLAACLAPQQPESALFEPYLADDVAFGPRNAGLSGPALVAAVRGGMAKAGLDYAVFRDRSCLALSGGEKRKAALAGVLAVGPELLLLDEPTAALDGPSRLAVLGGILATSGVLATGGATVLASTHSMEEAARFDFVAVLASGRLAAFGPPRAVFGPGWNPAWGLERPWAAAAAAELMAAGSLAADRWPLDAAELVAALSASPAAAPPLGQAAPAATAASVATTATAVVPPASAAVRAEPAGRAEPAAAAKRAGRPRRAGELELLRGLAPGQYLDRPSPLQRLGLGPKLLLLLAVLAAALAGPSLAFQFGVLAVVLAGGRLFAAVGPRYLLRGYVRALPFFLAVAALQILFAPAAPGAAVLAAWGPIDLSVGELRTGGLLLLRMATLMSALGLFSATTPVDGLTRSLDRAGAPLAALGLDLRVLSLAAGICLRFVPVLTEEAERIVVAQLARGAAFTGRGRWRASLAVIVPFFVRSLERAERLAQAMELRLFGSAR